MCEHVWALSTFKSYPELAMKNCDPYIPYFHFPHFDQKVFARIHSRHFLYRLVLCLPMRTDVF